MALKRSVAKKFSVAQQQNKPHNMYVNNGNNVPSYPGQQLGITQAQAREMYGNATRSKGYLFSGNTDTTSNKIDIPGDASFMLGIATLNGSWASIELKLNNTTIIDSTDTGFTKMGDNKEFYRIELPLTGRDTVVLTITGYAAYNNEPVVFIFI